MCSIVDRIQVQQENKLQKPSMQAKAHIHVILPTLTFYWAQLLQLMLIGRSLRPVQTSNLERGSLDR
jgi:hypothetical protein